MWRGQATRRPATASLGCSNQLPPISPIPLPSTVQVVRSYMEALGLLAAHKAGVNPACLTPEITPIRDLEVYMEDLADPPANDE